MCGYLSNLFFSALLSVSPGCVPAAETRDGSQEKMATMETSKYVTEPLRLKTGKPGKGEGRKAREGGESQGRGRKPGKGEKAGEGGESRRRGRKPEKGEKGRTEKGRTEKGRTEKGKNRKGEEPKRGRTEKGKN